MKIRSDFVTNSSSTCYVLDKSKLTAEELNTIRVNYNLSHPCKYGVGRGSVYGEGQDVSHYLEYLVEHDKNWGYKTPLTAFLKENIEAVGLPNIIFVRSSDEGMGGWVESEKLIASKAVAEMEYH